jgi:hypothetical protein
MGASRIDIFRMMLEGDPDNTSVMFGLAKEYEKAGRFDEMIEVLSEYLQRADDEGNAYGMKKAPRSPRPTATPPWRRTTASLWRQSSKTDAERGRVDLHRRAGAGRRLYGARAGGEHFH